MMMDSLRIEHRTDPTLGVELVAPQGEIDISSVELLDRELQSAVARRPRRLLVDLSQVNYLDSAGITVLLHARQTISRIGGELVLVGGSPFIRRLFRMIGVGRLFTHYETIGAALASVTNVHRDTPISGSAVGTAAGSHAAVLTA
jgi:anti-anti-sigma factor